MGALLFGGSLTLRSKGRGRREGRMVLEEIGNVDARKLFTEPTNAYLVREDLS